MSPLLHELTLQVIFANICRIPLLVGSQGVEKTLYIIIQTRCLSRTILQALNFVLAILLTVYMKDFEKT